MKLFDLLRPKTPRAQVLKRERDLMEKLDLLLEQDNEELLLQCLEKEFGIRRNDPRAVTIVKVWREQYR